MTIAHNSRRNKLVRCDKLSTILNLYSPLYIPKYPSALYVFRKQSNLNEYTFSVTNTFVTRTLFKLEDVECLLKVANFFNDNVCF